MTLTQRPSVILSHLIAMSCLLACGSTSNSGPSPITGATAGDGNQSGAGSGGPVTANGGSTQLNVSPGGSGGADGSGSPGGTNGAVQCNGRFSGRLRDFTVAQDSTGRPLDSTAVPAIADTIAGVSYLVSPDFEFANAMLNPTTARGKRFGPDPGLVAATLGADRTPVYAGPAEGTVTTTGPANFATWFHDTPNVNMAQNLTLQFLPDPSKPTDPNAYYFDSSTMGCATARCPGFFPIDGQLLGNEGNPHNYHMTFELHLEFKYHPGDVFTFIGDDDIWVFIDNKLALDLGGTHNEVTGQVMLDSLGLADGQTYPLAFFWSERHVTGSNLRIETSLEVTGCGDPPIK
ncbi:MAG TPA: fibro-slime domain-containing protein [Polyangiaceae bacterium]|nr:fibro-slime domain-containing protein [Polyangiaceae bacterium]